MQEDRPVPVLCPQCGGSNIKTCEWVRKGADDFKCQECHALVHLSTVDWLEALKACETDDKTL